MILLGLGTILLIRYDLNTSDIILLALGVIWFAARMILLVSSMICSHPYDLDCIGYDFAHIKDDFPCIGYCFACIGYDFAQIEDDFNCIGYDFVCSG